MAIARWSPITDLMSLHSAMDRLFNEVITPASTDASCAR
jgi:hypothetical protein